MWFLDRIVSWLNTIKEWLFSAYLEVNSWVYPFNQLATPLWNIYTAFIYLTAYFSFFNAWVNDTAIKLTTILSFTNIASHFSYYFNVAAHAWNWIVNAWGNVTPIISSWWSYTSATVQSWIDSAKQLLLLLIGELELWLIALQAAWDTFKSMIPSISEILSWFTDWWGWILARIIEWGGLPASLIQGMINSTLSDWFPWYDELASLWSNIRDFFTDPLQWVYDKLDEFFERFW